MQVFNGTQGFLAAFCLAKVACLVTQATPTLALTFACTNAKCIHFANLMVGSLVALQSPHLRSATQTQTTMCQMLQRALHWLVCRYAATVMYADMHRAYHAWQQHKACIGISMAGICLLSTSHMLLCAKKALLVMVTGNTQRAKVSSMAA